MAEQTDVERQLRQLEAELKKLEAEYNMFFAGALPRPPWETRGRVDAIIKRFDRLKGLSNDTSNNTRSPMAARARSRPRSAARRRSICSPPRCSVLA